MVMDYVNLPISVRTLYMALGFTFNATSLGGVPQSWVEAI
jgi:hypothetical protein